MSRSGGDGCPHRPQNELNLERIAADAKLYRTCKEQQFADHAWGPVAESMCIQAYTDVVRLIKTGEMCRMVNGRLGVSLYLPADFSKDDREDLATEIVTRAIERFRRDAEGEVGWSEDCGCTLREYFFSMCVKDFANAFRAMRDHRARTILADHEKINVVLSTLGEPDTTVPPRRSAADIVRAESAMTRKQRTAFRLVLDGMSFEQVADLMRSSPAAVKELLRRAAIRNRMSNPEESM